MTIWRFLQRFAHGERLCADAPHPFRNHHALQLRMPVDGFLADLRHGDPVQLRGDLQRLAASAVFRYGRRAVLQHDVFIIP